MVPESWRRGDFRDILEVERSNLDTCGTWKVERIEDSKLTLSCHDCWLKGLLNDIA
jgi:hypothetical protein